MRALVTGATGFIGSYLVARLVRDGADVAVLLRPGTDAWRIRELLPRVTRLDADLSELAAAEPSVASFAPDTVFHLAWHGVGNAAHHDIAQIDANLHPTLELVRLAGRIGCRTWIGLGSQAEYGPANCRLNETAPTQPVTTYGVAKLCAGLLAERLATENEMRFAWLRVFSTYGPKDNPGWLLPYLIRTLLRGETPELTRCEQQWDYLYVEDAAEALCHVANTPAARGVFNLGSGRTVSLRSVVERVRDLIDPRLSLGFGAQPYRPNQVMHLEADVTRLQSVTGWTARTPLEDGLKRTVDWHRSAEADIT